ncbi:GT2 family glycosyltransferase [Kineothrix alysoides]|uniref:GT2 family glycosyltransferase n=1 Tax=Kineothrix alysoides TaxID=1469948 RepID=A0A4R1R1S9_9FIRM|nr:glycosyltransferase [Kineothrix alysoides]TCL59294.1 GT2 family glycosyltransferase [Kineothrix alysoides]
MGGGMKAWLKGKLIEGQRKRYDRLFEKKSVSYDEWIRKREETLKERLEEGTKAYGGRKLKVKQVPYETVKDYLTTGGVGKEEADIVLFQASGGKCSELSEELISSFFLGHPQISMIYGDEDVLSPDGIRYTPWLKPDWSPDTFLSCFYFGSVFAVRTHALMELSEAEILSFGGKEAEEERVWIYRMCHLLAQKAGGFEKRRKGSLEEFPVGHIDEILFHSFLNREGELLYSECSYCFERNTSNESRYFGERDTFDGDSDSEKSEKHLVSIIIPSKDNEEVLKRCIESVKGSAKMPYEIILVDNGSEEQTRKSLNDYLSGLGIKYTYIYEKMPFHFSAMCNMGASAAAGEVCLFLNDDVDVPGAVEPKEAEAKERKAAGWLEKLYAEAVKPYAGAVGVKLLYPDSDRVQHGGIVNLRLGPVHKLQFKDNNEQYYYGWNRGMRNVIAVTGACLAVAKEKFEEVGGFPEELPVAFNDVDLCFSLYEKGYYNTVLQETVLYHYESLSRGQDEERGKLERLLAEKRKLYARHRGLYGKDPFHHKYLAGDMLSAGFELRADYDWQENMPYGKVVEVDGLLDGAREDACVMISLEYAGTLDEWRYGIEAESGPDSNKQDYYIQGYSFVAGSDNACYEKRILLERTSDGAESLKKEGYRLFAVSPELFLRKDVEQNLPDQVNVGMAGFGAVLRGKDAGEGNYRLGILVKDKCSGQKLYSWTNRYLNIK